jgi:hypothetical protein
MHLKLEDVDRDGRVLLAAEDFRTDIMGTSGDARERDLSWFHLQTAAGLSSNGGTLIFTWLNGFDYASYMRKTDGSPAVRLGDGRAQALSPDGKWVIAASFSSPNALTVLPTGPGDMKTVPLSPVRLDSSISAQWMPDGQRIVFAGVEPGHRIRSYVVRVAGGPPTALTPEGVVGTLVSPDNRFLIVRAPDGRSALYDVTANQTRDLPGLLPGERASRWDATGHAVYVTRAGENPMRVVRVDVATGVRELALQIAHGDAAGTITGVLVTPDARTAVYNVHRRTSDLYLVTGLR